MESQSLVKFLASTTQRGSAAVRLKKLASQAVLWRWFAVGLLVVLLTFPGRSLSAQSIGWLEVLQTRGRVTLIKSPPRVAQIGDRLSRIGDALETGPNSSAILRLDESIGTINIAENTSLRIRRLGRLRSGARVTKLDLTQGQVRLHIRRFNNFESRLEIQSPAGVAAVRGTEYGISLGQDGRMIIATESGLVTAAALGETVYLEPDFGSRLRPGEPPSPPSRLDRELWLELDGTEINARQLYVSGKIAPLNSVSVAGTEVSVSDQGQFAVTMPLPNSTSLFDFDVVVSNALGEKRSHSLVAW